MNNLPTENLEVKTDNEVYKCPSCGSNMAFNPDTNTLSCDYCGNHIAIAGQNTATELDFFAASDVDNSWQAESKVVHCANCGANTVVDINDIARVCPFCGSPSVENTDQLVGMKPTAVVPFKVGKEAALSKYITWIRRKAYVPSIIKKELPNPNFHGIYMPAWTYDASTFSTYDGRFGERYTVTVGSGKNRRTVTKIRYYNVRGTISNDFDDILITASSRFDQKQLDHIAPFNTNQSKEYDKRYLAGFSAEHYSVSVKKGWDSAKKKMENTIRNNIIRKYRPDVISYLNVRTHYDKVKYKYVLIPLWKCTFQYANKEYGFIVNGENGKITGKYPISVPKVVLTVAIFIIIIIGALLIFSYLSGNNTDYMYFLK